MKDSLRISTVLPVSPERLYKAWLSSREHAAFTGAKAVVQPRIGGKYSAWDGYIEGSIVELEPCRRIVHTWRTLEFADDDADSRLEVLFEAEDNATRLTLIHSALPAGQVAQYKAGWQDYYFEPMQAYFSRLAAKASPRKPRTKTTAA